MNKKVNLNAEVLKILYAENKEFLVPVGVIFVSILLLIFFIVPQINGFFQKQSQIPAKREKLANLQKSASSLSLTNDLVLDKDLKIVSSALPPSKDFAAILNAISGAASVAGVALGDFEFQIGDISKTNTQPTGTPSIEISLNITGSVETTVSFVKELKKTIPISEIAGVKSSGSFAAIELVFYYKPFPPQGVTDPEKIRPINQESQKMIDGIEVPINLDLNTLGVPSINSVNPI